MSVLNINAILHKVLSVRVCGLWFLWRWSHLQYIVSGIPYVICKVNVLPKAEIQEYVDYTWDDSVWVYQLTNSEIFRKIWVITYLPGLEKTNVLLLQGEWHWTFASNTTYINIPSLSSNLWFCLFLRLSQLNIILTKINGRPYVRIR